MVKNLKVKNKLGRNISKLAYLKILKTNILFKTKGAIQYVLSMKLAIDLVEKSYKSNVKNAEICQYENCNIITNFEVHHINL